MERTRLLSGLLLCASSYVAGTEAGQSGDDLIAEAGGGLVVVNMEYRLGVFGE